MGKSEEETITNDSDPLLEKKNEAADPSSQLSPPQPANVIALEIEDAETDASSTACCRICLEAESEIVQPHKPELESEECKLAVMEATAVSMGKAPMQYCMARSTTRNPRRRRRSDCSSASTAT